MLDRARTSLDRLRSVRPAGVIAITHVKARAHACAGLAVEPHAAPGFLRPALRKRSRTIRGGGSLVRRMVRATEEYRLGGA